MRKCVDVTEAQLATAVAEHKEWLRSQGKMGKRLRLHGTNLRLRDLHACDLTKASFAGSNFNGVNLRGARLAGAKLRDTDLTNADLRSSDLTGADLSRTTMVGATLQEACLARSVLTMADLRGADLKGALLNETILAAVNLTGARGLSRCHHAGPSVLDFRTIERSRGLPDDFLVGCGVPLPVAQEIPKLMPEVTLWPACFIVHAEENLNDVRALCTALRDGGVRAWAVPNDLPPESPARPVLDRLANVVVIVLVSEHSADREWLEEVSRWAKNKEKADCEDILFFIDLDASRLEAERVMEAAKDQGVLPDEPTYLRRSRSLLHWYPGASETAVEELLEQLSTSRRRWPPQGPTA